MTAIIILAAGESNRLGKPKQNLLFQNKTLLSRAVETALQADCGPVIVILGANESIIKPNIPHEKIEVISNPYWAEGMSSSIRAGISAIEKYLKIDSILIMLCDQPFVNAELIGKMLALQQGTSKAIVACSYNNTIGVPVLFKRSLFRELLLLKGNDGAKKILKNHPDETALIAFDKGHIDIDTEDDYNRLINSDN